jgi:hypothetical protein
MMTLRSVHLAFVWCSVVLTVFFAAWTFEQYKLFSETSYLGLAVGSLAAGAVLVIYAARFRSKTKWWL